MSVVDLRQTNSRQIAALLDEETQRWREELHWDYRGSLELIKKFVDAKSLAGGVAMENGQIAGYSFYVLEEHKALLGGLYVSSRWPQLRLAEELLDYTLLLLLLLEEEERGGGAGGGGGGEQSSVRALSPIGFDPCHGHSTCSSRLPRGGGFDGIDRGLFTAV